MGQEHSKQDRSEGRKDNDQDWLKEAVGSLTKDDKKRAEEEIDGATDRIEQAAGSLSERRIFFVPGMGITCSPCAKVQAMATCAGVAPSRSATALTVSTMRRLPSIASLVKRGVRARESFSSKPPREESAPVRE